ncbi:FirrV-1-B34 [Feldmannia irregularis virus a]|uniref:FirrV-1-B34 n=1 Tax=Feldmannia irregularis virus a TaxID=231992 RepID=Q6XM02_9PHYC|nr:FirrV-1-B34 [Feldmannia irregularis virus a]AAR26909.1 FirrV-1-B34 [Feldmannia irregularis virus a]
MDGFDDLDFVGTGSIKGREAIMSYEIDSRTMIKAHLRAFESDLVNGGGFLECTAALEDRLTPRGLKKLLDLKISIRLRVAQDMREKQRTEAIPAMTQPLEFPLDDADGFTTVLQKWATMPEDDPKYYLHMVFRFYMKDYHDFLVNKGQVIFYPSYQTILDILYPSDAAIAFPPEFRAFMKDAHSRSLETPYTPLPVKGDAKKVSLQYNFEALPDVATQRRYIERVFDIWKQTSFCTYPTYLCTGKPGCGYVENQFIYFRKIKRVKKEMEKLVNFPRETLAKLDTLVCKYPLVHEVYLDYAKNSSQFSSERKQFRRIMLQKFRKHFVMCKELGIHSDLARHVVERNSLLSAAPVLDHALQDFEKYCTKKIRVYYSESSVGTFLALTQGVLSLLECYGLKHLALMDESMYLCFTITEGIRQATMG